MHFNDLLFQHESGMNCSYDDLPPPPPPLSSSPSPPHDHDHSDTNSSVVTAQMPVPQLRSSIRRNEYVNIPVQPKVCSFMIYKIKIVEHRAEKYFTSH